MIVKELAIIIFTRYPKPGQTKTRLISLLGQVGAAELHQHILEHTIKQADKGCDELPVHRIISFNGGNQTKMNHWLGPDGDYFQQQGKDLGENLRQTMEYAFDKNFRKVLLVGSDIPGIRSAILKKGFRFLNDKDMVLGPAADGGYYLIGMHKNAYTSGFFNGINWGLSSVLEETITLAQKSDLSYSLLEKLHDIDTPEDLNWWRINHSRQYSRLMEDKDE